MRRLSPSRSFLETTCCHGSTRWWLAGCEFRNLDTNEPLGTVRARVQSANAYIGAFVLADALATGADVVVAGRAADAALGAGADGAHLRVVARTIGTGWPRVPWPGTSSNAARRRPAATVRRTGRRIPDLAHIGYPIVEVEADGTSVVTKHAGSGGRVSAATVKEQLLYEIGDPRAYITPDVIADFTTIRLEEIGPDRVRVSGVRGRPRTPFLKVSASYAAGWKSIGTLVYSRPDALAKAQGRRPDRAHAGSRELRARRSTKSTRSTSV